MDESISLEMTRVTFARPTLPSDGVTSQAYEAMQALKGLGPAYWTASLAIGDPTGELVKKAGRAQEEIANLVECRVYADAPPSETERKLLEMVACLHGITIVLSHDSAQPPPGPPMLLAPAAIKAVRTGPFGYTLIDMVTCALSPSASTYPARQSGRRRLVLRAESRSSAGRWEGEGPEEAVWWRRRRKRRRRGRR